MGDAVLQRRESHATASGSTSHVPPQRRPAGSQGQPGSLAALRKQLAAAKALQAARTASSQTAAEASKKSVSEQDHEAGKPAAVQGATSSSPEGTANVWNDVPHDFQGPT